VKILFACQFYSPSVGGVQEVIRQIAERLVVRGHQVTVATTALPNRNFESLNGVTIRGFEVRGNGVTGMTGAVADYQRFVRDGDFDVVMIYAAQQWTFDALWPVLDEINFAKVFLPCGFSGLYEPGYQAYFNRMAAVLARFDRLIFNATHYRDIDFARAAGLDKLLILPNGASEFEFGVAPDAGFRARHGIDADAFLFLTVGSFTGLKGHQELAGAFARLSLPTGRKAVLILNGNEVQRLERGPLALLRKFAGLARTHGLRQALRQAFAKLGSGSSSSPRGIAQQVNASQPAKKVLILDLPRAELTQAFMAADLFVFASNIEYSPLVLFETAAAGTPFLSVDVGNSLEIAEWTGAGLACASRVDALGYTRVDEAVLAARMAELMTQPQLLRDLGAVGRQSWREKFTWQKISERYEALFSELMKERQ
jgi:glycosyltransferase involved in cell wall biosynthesis